jgi:hypothetical protein
MTFVPVFFIYVPPAEAYRPVAADDEAEALRRNSALMHRPSHWRAKLARSVQNPKQGKPFFPFQTLAIFVHNLFQRDVQS